MVWYTTDERNYFKMEKEIIKIKQYLIENPLTIPGVILWIITIGLIIATIL